MAGGAGLRSSARGAQKARDSVMESPKSASVPGAPVNEP